MKAIAAHFRHISKHGRVDIEGERGETIFQGHVTRDMALLTRHPLSGVDHLGRDGLAQATHAAGDQHHMFVVHGLAPSRCQIRSNTAAMPCPPPMHIVTSA